MLSYKSRYYYFIILFNIFMELCTLGTIILFEIVELIFKIPLARSLRINKYMASLIPLH